MIDGRSVLGVIPARGGSKRLPGKNLLPVAGRRFHMTHLFERMLADGRPTAAFPIREYSIDIGQIDDFTRANGDYSGMFEV